MFVLVRVQLRYGKHARCVVTHMRPGTEEADRVEILEDRTITRSEAQAIEGERGWVIPMNPRPGDQIRFDLVEVQSIGPGGAGYRWDVLLCGINGPARIDEPRIFSVTVPEQISPDLAECPEVEIDTVRAVKDGERGFCWTVTPDALAA